MAEFIYRDEQTVESGQNVLFNESVIRGNCKVVHRAGSGIVTLKGTGKSCCDRNVYRVHFNGNMAIPTGETLGEITLAITLAGEPLGGGVMLARPTGAELYFNVSAEVLIELPGRCCETVAVRNLSPIPVLVENANIIVERVG